MRKRKNFLLGVTAICLLLFKIGNVCPIEHITGFPCPGCNIFTALYWLLLKLDVRTAFYFHPAVFFFLAFIVIVCLCYMYYRTWERVIRNKYVIFFGSMFMVILISVYVYRMATVFPNAPMIFKHDAILPKLLKEFIN